MLSLQDGFGDRPDMTLKSGGVVLRSQCYVGESYVGRRSQMWGSSSMSVRRQGNVRLPAATLVAAVDH